LTVSEKEPSAAIFKKAGKEYRSLSAEDKLKFQEAASADKERFEKEMIGIYLSHPSDC
jgi:hypothetical protein